MNELKLRLQRYKMFPYERELALREIKTQLRPVYIEEHPHSMDVVSPRSRDDAIRLTYFDTITDGNSEAQTVQSALERSAQNGDRAYRQATRYSVHGIHEYKGKFNPQVAHALLNILPVPKGGAVLDPFCGSGTTLVECSHSQLRGIGTDINPLAVHIASAKLDALRIPLKELQSSIKRTARPTSTAKKGAYHGSDERSLYLAHWFPSHTLQDIEMLRARIKKEESPRIRRLLGVIASDLLRDFSLQEPLDLRIRRRKEPPLYRPFHEAYLQRAEKLLERISKARDVIDTFEESKALNRDSTMLSRQSDFPIFDAVISSPPYATALPYIDTQRLSLVWLGLVLPSKLAALQAELIGSREFGASQRANTLSRLQNNSGHLPAALHVWCVSLQESLAASDGFRRQAVPVLLYRYFENMMQVFCGMKKHLKRSAHVALVIGHNHTTLGGTRIDIDTPGMLAQLAEHTGYAAIERMPLQAYQRYGLHQRNAVAREEILFFKKR